MQTSPQHPAHGTTRELNVGVITFVTVAFILLLIAIVAGSAAWFRYEYNARLAKTLAEDPARGANIALIKRNTEQLEHLQAGPVTIDDAMHQIAQRN